MGYKFKGIYAEHINSFIELKRSLGFKYVSEAHILSSFDRFTIKRNESVIYITKELVEQWCLKQDNESTSTQRKRYCIIKEFAKYMSKLGVCSHIPSMYIKENNDYVPYIYTKDEMNRIFNVCDNFQTGNQDLRSSIISMPTLIRILYATGMRIGEAVAILDKDVNLIDNYCILRGTKNGSDRIVPFSNSLSKVLSIYKKQRDKLPINISAESTFFVSLIGKPCKSDSINRRFKQILRLANIKSDKARLHDLRHTFAVHSLATMSDNGLDLYVSLSILSKYIGHKSLAATDRYVRLTVDMYPNLIEKVDAICTNVIPKTIQL